MYNNPILLPLVVLLNVTGPTLFDDKWMQYGFASILLGVLFWYSRKQFLASENREKVQIEELTKAQERHDKEMLAERNHHINEMKEANRRYHELHLEIMAILNSNFKLRS